MTIQYNRTTSHLSSNFSVPFPTTLRVTTDINPPLTHVPPTLLPPTLSHHLNTTKNYDDKAKCMPPPQHKKRKKEKKKEKVTKYECVLVFP